MGQVFSRKRLDEDDNEVLSRALSEEIVASLDHILHRNSVERHIQELLNGASNRLVKWKINARLDDRGYYKPYARFVRACERDPDPHGSLKFLLHGTPNKNIGSIARHGLRLRGSIAVWFSTSPEISSFYTGSITARYYTLLLFVTLRPIELPPLLNLGDTNTWYVNDPDCTLLVATLKMARPT